jgi:acid phosphatase family membrane protein YuiD
MNLPLFLIPVLVGVATQTLKPFLNKKWYAQLTKGGQKIPRYGGMPSAHTAFATSLATLAALSEGMLSMTFAITVSLVIFVLDDALRMRIFLSRHGEALRRLVRELPHEKQRDFPYLEARLGHKLPEVLVGAAIGILLTWALFALFT